jgi:uncharacterized protein involved in exopolysaccharide biosynthesis
VDEDIEHAAGAVAATLETAGRGVIYEHAPATLPAQRLATDLTSLLGQIRDQGGTVSDSEAAIALRAIEHGARDAKKTGGTDTSYASLIARLLQIRRAQAAGPSEPAKPASNLIVP